MEIAAAIVIATLVGPFLIGWWIGHPAFAAAAWGALGLTVLIRQAQVDTSEGRRVPMDHRRDARSRWRPPGTAHLGASARAKES